MKSYRAIAAICCAASISFLSGCLASSETTDPDPISHDAPFQVMMAKTTARQAADPTSASVATHARENRQFAVDLYRDLAGSSQTNLFFSPFSIQAALGMAAAGARNNTLTEMMAALRSSLSEEAFHQALNTLDQSLEGHAAENEGVTLAIENSQWAQVDWDFRVSFLDRLARSYGAGVNLLDFITRPEPSRVTINDWVADQTNDRIQDLLPPGSISTDTRLVLTNAIYFLGQWLVEFDPSETRPRSFTLLDGSTQQRDGMGFKNGEAKVLYARGDKVRAIDLAYQGERLAMTAFLPDLGTYQDFEAKLSVEVLDQLVARLAARSIPVMIPKFKFETGSVNLNAPLQRMGMVDAFSGGAADFSGIDGTKRLSVSSVVHKAFIQVDEKGTEAAAATGVVIGVTSVNPDPPQFIANRPFIYVIRDRETGAYLFMGRVLDPGVEQG